MKPGDIIAGKYRIIRVLGEGGMGIVVEAVHQTLDQRVAIKFHRPQSGAGAESVARFVREAKASAQIKSEHVVRVTDVATLDNGDPYFVMEYLEGRDLDTLVQTEGPVSVPVALEYALEVCEALAEAHALGIVHRDLKPANLFLANRPDGSVILKLLDFGISKTLPKGADAELSMTKTRALMGSPLYMAPEQMRSTRRVDHRADIWSMGVLLHEILTGETPFVGETLPEVCASIAADAPIPLRAKRPDAPVELEDVILRCLEKESEHRFADVADLALALAPISPPEAARSIGRIVRILRGQGATPGLFSMRSTMPPPSSQRPPMRPSTPFASVVPSASDPNADTLCIEPSDQRRSGVAAKMRIRASSPEPSVYAGETLAAAPTSQPPPPLQAGQASSRKKLVVGAIAFTVVAAIALVSFPRQASHQDPVASAVTARVAAPPSSPAAPVAPLSGSGGPSGGPNPDPASGNGPASESIEFVDVPAAARATSPQHLSARPVSSSPAPQVLSKAAQGDAGAHAAPAPSGSAAGPAPSGTAAFGAVRD